MRRSTRHALVTTLTLVVAGTAIFGFGEFWKLRAISQHPFWLYKSILLVRDTVTGIDAENVELPEDFAPTVEAGTALLYEENCGPAMAVRELLRQNLR